MIEKIHQSEIHGEVRVKALFPGNAPKVQIKLALPEEYDDFRVHPMTVRAENVVQSYVKSTRDVIEN